jgi:hypothetical protein
MLKIKDLNVSKEMDAPEMAGICGGLDPFAAIDFSTSFVNKVADVKQLFGFEFAQGNVGTVTNNQAILGGNGISYAPVYQEQSQANYMDVSKIGNVSVS